MFGHDEGSNQQAGQTDLSAIVPPTDGAVQETTSTDTTQLPTFNVQDTSASATDTAPAVATSPVVGDDGLLDIKQQALQQLGPLVGHLDQSPEEKFRTTMMMIQAADDQSLIKDAYEAAQQITDDKTRAQALLDVINEINYFTQQNA